MLVAASESERAQTRVRAFWGSDCIRDPMSLVETFWEVIPKRVKVPYTKDEKAWQYPEYVKTRETLTERAGTTP